MTVPASYLIPLADGSEPTAKCRTCGETKPASAFAARCKCRACALTRKCYLCHERKPLEEFATRAGRPGNLCRICAPGAKGWRSDEPVPIKGEREAPSTAVEPRLCACGCGQEVPRASAIREPRYCHGHKNQSVVCSGCGTTRGKIAGGLCSPCRHQASKKTCPVEGCTALISPESRSCQRHRRLFLRAVYPTCGECGVPNGTRLPVCQTCIQTVQILCKCGCGRYRKKYGKAGQLHEYVSGHNDAWKGHRRPEIACAMCGKMFYPAASRTRLCSIACRTQWLTINPARERQRVLVECAICGKPVYRVRSDTRPNRLYSCCRAHRDMIVGLKRRAADVVTDPKRLALRRDHARCVICAFDIVVEVHHIEARRRNGEGGEDSLDNMVTLCPNHHEMADRALISKEELRAYVGSAGAVAQ